MRTGWNSGRSRPLAYRKNQIKQLGFLIQDNEDAFVQALASDVRRPSPRFTLIVQLGRDRTGSYIGDLNIVKSDVKHVLSHIDKWAKPESIGFSLVWAATRPKIYKEAKGVVLIVRVDRPRCPDRADRPVQLPDQPAARAADRRDCRWQCRGPQALGAGALVILPRC